MLRNIVIGTCLAIVASASIAAKPNKLSTNVPGYGPVVVISANGKDFPGGSNSIPGNTTFYEQVGLDPVVVRDDAEAYAANLGVFGAGIFPFTLVQDVVDFRVLVSSFASQLPAEGVPLEVSGYVIFNFGSPVLMTNGFMLETGSFLTYGHYYAEQKPGHPNKKDALLVQYESVRPQTPAVPGAAQLKLKYGELEGIASGDVHYFDSENPSADDNQDVRIRVVWNFETNQ